MPSLRSLTTRAEVGYYYAWVAESALSGKGESTVPKTVTEIERRGDTIRVYADGANSAEHYYDVEPDGSSTAYYVNRRTGEHKEMGPLVFGELTDSKRLVEIKRGFYDSRDQSTDDTHPFPVGFDRGIVLVKANDKVITVEPATAEALAADLQAMAEKARGWEDSD
jgi:hypothetical protein